MEKEKKEHHFGSELHRLKQMNDYDHDMFNR